MKNRYLRGLSRRDKQKERFLYGNPTKPAVYVDDLSVIVDKMRDNKEQILSLLDTLNDLVTDMETYDIAARIVDNYHKAGVISGYLADHIKEELLNQINPKEKTSLNEGYDHISKDWIVEYIDNSNQWAIREVILHTATTLKHTGNLESCEATIYYYVSGGDIPENIGILTIMWLENIYTGDAQSFIEYNYIK